MPFKLTATFPILYMRVGCGGINFVRFFLFTIWKLYTFVVFQSTDSVVPDTHTHPLYNCTNMNNHGKQERGQSRIQFANDQPVHAATMVVIFFACAALYAVSVFASPIQFICVCCAVCLLALIICNAFTSRTAPIYGHGTTTANILFINDFIHERVLNSKKFKIKSAAVRVHATII